MNAKLREAICAGSVGIVLLVVYAYTPYTTYYSTSQYLVDQTEQRLQYSRACVVYLSFVRVIHTGHYQSSQSSLADTTRQHSTICIVYINKNFSIMPIQPTIAELVKSACLLSDGTARSGFDSPSARFMPSASRIQVPTPPYGRSCGHRRERLTLECRWGMFRAPLRVFALFR